MGRPNYGPAILMMLGGLLLFASNSNAVLQSNAVKWLSTATKSQSALMGTRLLLVHEKKYPKPNEVSDVRRAKEFTSTNGFAGFLDVDKDDSWVAPISQKLQQSLKLDPPYLAAAVLKDGKIVAIARARAWNSLEDILK